MSRLQPFPYHVIVPAGKVLFLHCLRFFSNRPNAVLYFVRNVSVCRSHSFIFRNATVFSKSCTEFFGCTVISCAHLGTAMVMVCCAIVVFIVGDCRTRVKCMRTYAVFDTATGSFLVNFLMWSRSRAARSKSIWRLFSFRVIGAGGFYMLCRADQ